MGTKLLLFLSLLAFGAQEQAKKGGPAPTSPYIERSQKEFPFYPGGKIEITGGVPGSVAIIGWSRPMVRLETETVVYYLPSQEAKVVASQYPIQTSWTQTLAKIGTVGPTDAAATMEVNLTLHVPKHKTDFIIRITKGDLEADGLNGWVEATLAEGNIEARSMEGYFSVVTEVGDLDVEMDGTRWYGHGFTAVTNQGSVELRLPVKYSAALQLETHDGDITIDYPEQIVDGQYVPLHFITRKKVRNLTATVGAGGAPVKLFTDSGNIRLTKIEKK
jgi:DUF4097 and DUF4098 domain-containing protein YvlB